jgi:hypothetical protein
LGLKFVVFFNSNTPEVCALGCFGAPGRGLVGSLARDASYQRRKIPRNLAGVFPPIARFFVGFGIREILFSKVYGAGVYEGRVFSKSVMVAVDVLYRAYSFAIGGLSLLNSVSA